MLDEVFELFLSLGATDEQLDFPTLYCVGREGIAKRELEDPSEDLTPLLETIVNTVPPPVGDIDGPFQMLITTIDYNDFLGRVGIGKIARGTIRLGNPMKVIRRDGRVENARVTKIFGFDGLKRIEINEASAGDIIAIAGMDEVDIGETIADQADPTALPFVSIEEPTISMHFLVNNSPFAGQEGTYVTTRNIERAPGARDPFQRCSARRADGPPRRLQSIGPGRAAPRHPDRDDAPRGRPERSAPIANANGTVSPT